MLLRRKPLPKGAMMALYLMGYGIARFCIEFFREPDAHLGFVFFSLSMGQMLCLAMIAAGAGLYGWLHFRAKRIPAGEAAAEGSRPQAPKK
jgi:phosphatidylglycerol:prolipoprotein diacylglycerol transferase